MSKWVSIFIDNVVEGMVVDTQSYAAIIPLFELYLGALITVA